MQEKLSGAHGRVNLLPRSSYRSAREEARATQRGRMLTAMVEAVAQKGYVHTSVADVVAAAGVSRKTFYVHFDDKEDCFLAAYDVAVQALLGEIASRLEDQGDWRARLEAALRTYLEILAGEPAFACAYLVEVWAAGRTALERRGAVQDRFVAVLRGLHERAREQDPGLPEVSDVVLHGLVGGLSQLMAQQVIARRTEKLPELAPEMMRFVLSVLGGTSRAAPIVAGSVRC